MLDPEAVKKVIGKRSEPQVIEYAQQLCQFRLEHLSHFSFPSIPRPPQKLSINNYQCNKS